MVRDATEATSDPKRIYGEDVVIGEDYQLSNGNRITIKGGQYWGEHGVSNFWDWYNHKTGEKENGYGGFYELEAENMKSYIIFTEKEDAIDYIIDKFMTVTKNENTVQNAMDQDR